VNFDDYLIAKRIDATAFRQSEPDIYQQWAAEFSQLHPNSFTMQKLNLMNPIRRKFHLKSEDQSVQSSKLSESSSQQPSTTKPGKPVMRPKPKID